MLVLLGFAAA